MGFPRKISYRPCPRTGKVQQRLLCVGQLGPADVVGDGELSAAAATGPACATAPSGPAEA